MTRSSSHPWQPALALVSMAIALRWAPPEPAGAQSPEADVIARAQAVSTAELDPVLPRQPFAAWLGRVAGAGATVTWEANDCGEQTGTPEDAGRDFPVCAEADALLPDGRKVIVLIAVGTLKKGIAGPPEVWDVSIERTGTLWGVRRLRDLPQMLREGIGR